MRSEASQIRSSVSQKMWNFNWEFSSICLPKVVFYLIHLVNPCRKEVNNFTIAIVHRIEEIKQSVEISSFNHREKIDQKKITKKANRFEREKKKSTYRKWEIVEKSFLFYCSFFEKKGMYCINRKIDRK